VDGWMMDGRTGMDGDGWKDRQTARLIHSIGLTDSFIHSFIHFIRLVD